jgi:hypothetical protein
VEKANKMKESLKKRNVAFDENKLDTAAKTLAAFAEADVATDDSDVQVKLEAATREFNNVVNDLRAQRQKKKIDAGNAEVAKQEIADEFNAWKKDTEAEVKHVEGDKKTTFTEQIEKVLAEDADAAVTHITAMSNILQDIESTVAFQKSNKEEFALISNNFNSNVAAPAGSDKAKHDELKELVEKNQEDLKVRLNDFRTKVESVIAAEKAAAEDERIKGLNLEALQKEITLTEAEGKINDEDELRKIVKTVMANMSKANHLRDAIKRLGGDATKIEERLANQEELRKGDLSFADFEKEVKSLTELQSIQKEVSEELQRFVGFWNVDDATKEQLSCSLDTDADRQTRFVKCVSRGSFWNGSVTKHEIRVAGEKISVKTPAPEAEAKTSDEGVPAAPAEPKQESAVFPFADQDGFDALEVGSWENKKVWSRVGSFSANFNLYATVTGFIATIMMLVFLFKRHLGLDIEAEDDLSLYDSEEDSDDEELGQSGSASASRSLLSGSGSVRSGTPKSGSVVRSQSPRSGNSN